MPTRRPAVRFRPYVPKPLDPGQPFDALGLTGVVWSAGPEASSLWVRTDDGAVRAVKLRTGTPTRILTDYDNWKERAAEVARSPWLDQQYRRVS